MKRRKAIGVTVVGVIGLVAISGAVINVVKTYVAPLSTGEIRVAGLSADVEITRNEIGVPHIRAVTFDDALFGLGYAHAEDRLWQMEMNRRIGAGRLSEIFGPETLDKDKFLRTLGVYRVAERSFANLTDRAQAAFRSYALGVNAFFETRRGFLPLEFLLLGHEPEPWQVEDSLVWLKMMAWDLGGNWEKEWLRYRLMQRLSPAQVEEFLPPHPGDERPALPDFRSLYAEAGFDGERLLAMAPAVLPDGAGSNNWVVSGEHTTSGKPLLANDPHLGLQAPAVWYYARLTTPDLDVVGATLPGVPGIYLGHNGRIAWGFTNTGPDVQDLYIEKIVAGEPDRYLAPDGPRPFTVRQERIFIKDDDPVTLMVRTSRHGPILSDVLGSARTELPQDYALALAWTALREDDLTAQAVFGIMAAKDWAQFKEALRSFHTPQQSIVYADVEGNIGFYAAGRIPLRKGDNDAMGLLPVPGWGSKYDWDGFVPFEELPQSFNPESGFVVTANQKIVPDDYPHHLTYDWTLPYRARRLEALITGYESHSLETFKEMQGDVLSLVATELLPLMANIEPSGELGKQALDLLNVWDRRMEGDRPEPLIFYGWMRDLTRLVYADELGPLFQKNWKPRPLFMKHVLSNSGGQAVWCNNTTTSETETCRQLLELALDLALADLADRYGDDPRDWRWAEAHYAHSEHRPFTRDARLSWLFDIKVESPGGPYTLNVGRPEFADEDEPFASHHAASLRAIYDLGDLDRSVFVQTTGQSGNPLSANYDSLAWPWSERRYAPLSTRVGPKAARANDRLELKGPGG